MIKPSEIRLYTFYKFVDIENPVEEVQKQKSLLMDIGVKGRIYISEEGINAQFTANTGQIMAYRLYLDSSVYFKDIPDIDVKSTHVKEHQFAKMTVRYRQEIVAMGRQVKSKDIEKHKKKVSIDEFKSILQKNPNDYVFLDMRNEYEYKLGHFKNAVPAGTFTFKEINETVEKYKQEFQNKEIIMYCTGGIRCEKAAVLLADSGMNDVKQLDGGIIKYLNNYNDENWLGNLYTFDNRVSVGVGSSIVGVCHYTNKPANKVFNCRYNNCEKQIIALPDEYKHHFGFCSESCYQHAIKDLLIRNIEWDELDYKLMRREIKRNPEKKETYSNLIREHLFKKMERVSF